MSTIDIRTISSLGTIDAETDFKPEFFVPSTSWENVRRGARPIVVGRKGTGKTALRFQIREEASTSPTLFARDLAFRDYPWAVHFSIYDTSVGGRSRYQETWLFLMLVELAKLAVGESQARPATSDGLAAADALRRFLRDTWGGVTFDHRETFRREKFRVTKASFAPTVVGTSLGSVDWMTVERKTLGDALSGMNRWLRAALELVAQRDAEYFLVFDELDLDFGPGEDPYLDSMIGLVLAAQSVFLWSADAGLAVRPVVLLRDDIYGELAFPDKNKITTNLLELIEWTAELDGPDSLKRVIDKRILAVLGLAGAPDPWLLLFDDQLMRGTQPKYLHIAQRTYLRPRDAIFFVNECIIQARLRGGIVDGSRITNDDVARARPAYSKYLRSELDDEIHAHYPDWQDWLELLRRIGYETFSRDKFDAQCTASPQLTHGAEPHDILGVFYRFGVIGFGRRGGGGRGGTNEYWSYRDRNTTFDTDAPFFRVHPGLKETLDLREERH